MEAFFQEYGLLIAVATPVVVIVAMQAVLFIAGERDTLLFPSMRSFESIAISEGQPIATPVPTPMVVETDSRGHRLAASYDERKAA